MTVDCCGCWRGPVREGVMLSALVHTGSGRNDGCERFVHRFCTHVDEEYFGLFTPALSTSVDIHGDKLYCCDECDEWGELADYIVRGWDLILLVRSVTWL